MSSYTKSTDFASKDALLTGNPLKVVKGTELDDEFNSIQTAVNSKADTNSPALTGTPTAPTASAATNTTQIASTAFVQDQKASPVFSGTPTAPTASTGTDTTQLATTEFVQQEITANAYTLPEASQTVRGGIKIYRSGTTLYINT